MEKIKSVYVLTNVISKLGDALFEATKGDRDETLSRLHMAGLNDDALEQFKLEYLLDRPEGDACDYCSEVGHCKKGQENCEFWLHW